MTVKRSLTMYERLCDYRETRELLRNDGDVK
jgi:hypothetical protein